MLRELQAMLHEAIFLATGNATMSNDWKKKTLQVAEGVFRKLFTTLYPAARLKSPARKRRALIGSF